MDMRVRRLEGADVLDRLGPALDDLHAATATPVTARRPWLAAWIRSYPDHLPWAVVVESDGEIRAAALLARTRRRGITRIVALGDGPSDYARLPARDEESAGALARGLVEALRDLPGGWELRLNLLPPDDPVVGELRRALRWSAVVPAEGAPVIRFAADRTPRAYMSRNVYQTERLGWNRIRKDERVASLARVTAPADVDGVLPEVEAVRWRRDEDARGRSGLEDERERAFWRSVIPALAARGEAELFLLRLDDDLAAYTLCLVDGGAYRAWDGRLDPAARRYSSGRLVDLASLRCALIAGMREYDWMRGVEDYKLWTQSEVVPAESLLAWSSHVVRAALGTPKLVRASLRGVKDASPRLAKLWGRVRSGAAALRRRRRSRGPR